MERTNRSNIWIVIAALAGLLLGCLLGLMFGGFAAWGMSRITAAPAAVPAFEPVPRAPVVPDVRPAPEFAPTQGGVLITQVVPNSPAEAAGMQVGDIVTAIDGVSLRETRLADLVTDYAPGDTVALTLLRAGRQIELRVRLEAHPEQPGMAWIGIFYQEMPGGPFDGPTP